MLWDPFLYCINDSIQGNSETGNKVFTLPSEVSINSLYENSMKYLCNIIIKNENILSIYFLGKLKDYREMVFS